MSQRTIELGVHDICVLIDAKPGSPGSITCSPDLYETCMHCGRKECLYQCDGSTATEGGDSEATVGSRLQYNGAVDCTLAVILAHAIAGIDIEAPAYLEGIETALNAAAENI